MRRSSLKLSLLVGAVCGGLRLLSGLALMVYACVYPEAHALVLLDVLTSGLYFMLGSLGVPVVLTDANDMIFLVAGTVLWAAVGTTMVFTLSVLLTRRARSKL